MAEENQAIGSRAKLIICEEAIWGLCPAASPANDWLGIRYNTEAMVQDINAFRSAEIRSDRMVRAVLQGNKRPGGDIVTELNAEGITKLFKQLLGDNVQTTGSDPWTHEIKGYHTLPIGFSLEKGFLDIDKYIVYSGCRVNTLALTVPQEGIPTISWGLLAKTEDSDNIASLDTSPTYTENDPFTSFQCTISESALGVALGSLAIVQSFDLSITNNLKDDNFCIGNQERVNLKPGQRNVTGNMTILFQDLTLYDKYVNGTPAQLQAAFTDGTYTLTIFLPQIQYSGTSPTPRVPDAGPLVVTLPFEAEYNADELSDVTVTIINSESSV